MLLCFSGFFFVFPKREIPIEDMDSLFGGSQGQEDLERIAHIRVRLGITLEDLETFSFDRKDKYVDVPAVEEKE